MVESHSMQQTASAGGAGAPPNARPASFWATAAGEIRRNWQYYAMALPAVAAIIVFGYFPLVGVVIAFQDYSPVRGIGGSEWVGLANFESAFGSPFFRTALANTLILNTLKILFGFPAAITLALLLNEVRLTWFKRAVQTATILPYFISWVVAATMFRNLLAPEGVVNEILQGVFGLQPRIFLSDPQAFRWVIVFQDMWKYVGFFAILYLAAMSAIDPTLYEAAAVDGASRWQRVRHITLPGIRATMITILVLLTGWIIQGGFEQILVMYNSSVYSTGDILETLTLRLALSQSKYSLAAAIGLFQSAIALALVLGTHWLAKRWNQQGMF
jgi:ABC-type polysaccharide transport system permease subunit